MKSITSLMAWGLKFKNRRSSKKSTDQRNAVSVWINRPLPAVNEAMLTLAEPQWQWHTEIDRAGTMTRLSVATDQLSETTEIPADIVFATKVRNIKAAIETGEVPSVEGQPHGQRSILGESAEEIFDDLQWHEQRSVPQPTAMGELQ